MIRWFQFRRLARLEQQLEDYDMRYKLAKSLNLEGTYGHPNTENLRRLKYRVAVMQARLYARRELPEAKAL